MVGRSAAAETNHGENDVSVGFGFSGIYFAKPKSWRTALTENYTETEVGALGVSLSHAQNYDRIIGHGNATKSYGFGLSLGTDQLLLGVVNARVSHGYTYMIWGN